MSTPQGSADKGPRFLGSEDSAFFNRRKLGNTESLALSHYICTEHYDITANERINLTVIFSGHSETTVNFFSFKSWL